MKPIPDCVPDIIGLVLEAAHLVSDDSFIHNKVIQRVLLEMAELVDLGSDPTILALRSLQTAYKALGVRDPYEKDKARRLRALLGLESDLRAQIDSYPESEQSLWLLQLLLAGSANRDAVILGREQAKEIMKAETPHIPVIDDRARIIPIINAAETILILADSVTGLVPDKLFIDYLLKHDHQVTLAVAASSILQVATRQDVEAAKFPEQVKIIDPGAPMLGLCLEEATASFREQYINADVVIAKGEYHLQTLWPRKERPLVFISYIRCPYLSKWLDITPNNGVIIYHKPE